MKIVSTKEFPLPHLVSTSEPITREEYAEFFWARVDYFRKQKFMTWRQIATRMGFSTNNLNKYRYKHILPSAFIILQLSLSLEITMDDLCNPF